MLSNKSVVRGRWQKPVCGTGLAVVFGIFNGSDPCYGGRELAWYQL